MHLQRTIALCLATLALAASAQAQGRSEGKGHGHGRNDRDERVEGIKVHGADARGNGDGRGNGVRVPPGLAKKPGQMPPGQYKKRYGTGQGANILSEIMRQHGYVITRVVTTGTSQNVYFRTQGGAERVAIVSPGSDRLVFRNVPESLLQEVLARLY